MTAAALLAAIAVLLGFAGARDLVAGRERPMTLRGYGPSPVSRVALLRGYRLVTVPLGHRPPPGARPSFSGP